MVNWYTFACIYSEGTRQTQNVTENKWIIPKITNVIYWILSLFQLMRLFCAVLPAFSSSHLKPLEHTCLLAYFKARCNNEPTSVQKVCKWTFQCLLATKPKKPSHTDTKHRLPQEWGEGGEARRGEGGVTAPNQYHMPKQLTPPNLLVET